MSFPRYPEYKESGVEWLGEVPGHWVIPAAGYRYHIELGKMLDEKRVTGNYLRPYLRNSDVQWGRINAVDLPQMDFSGADIERYSLRKGDLLVCEGGDVGRAAIWDGKLSECYYQKALHRIRPRDAYRDTTEFLFYVFQAAVTNEVFTNATGKSTIAHLPAETLRRYRFPHPPLPEQTAIAAFLDRETAKIDALVAEQRRLIELLKEKRQSAISHAVTKGLHPDAPMKDSGIDWLGEVPAHWSIGSLTRIASRVVVGIAEAATHAYADEGIPILRSTNIRAGRIRGEILYVDPDFAAERGSKLINGGDLVTVRTGNAGVTAVVPNEFDGCQCFTMLITSLNQGSIAEYYCYWMNSLAAQCYFGLEGWGTAQVNISVPILKALPVPMPPTSEQEEVIKYLDLETAKLDTLTAEAQRAIDLLQERRAALISAAVTGQIDVRSLSITV